MKDSLIIETKSLQKVFNKDSPNDTILKDINIDVVKGKFIVVMGNSGSGKSTLLHLLAGLDEPTDGLIFVNGTAIHGLNEQALASFRRTHVGIVFQDHNLVSNLSLKDNILVAGYLTKKNRKIINAKVNALLEKLNISHLSDRFPAEVSGGERQRCAIARALINDPEILLADEPTGNLNSSTSKKVLNIFNELNQSGQSILMVTHDLNSACHGNEVLFIKDGRLIDSLHFEKNCEHISRQKILLNWLQNLGW